MKVTLAKIQSENKSDESINSHPNSSNGTIISVSSVFSCLVSGYRKKNVCKLSLHDKIDKQGLNTEINAC